MLFKRTFEPLQRNARMIFCNPCYSKLFCTYYNYSFIIFLLLGTYLYLESSYPTGKGDTAMLISPKILVPRLCMDFYSHMYGERVGRLRILRLVKGQKPVELWAVGGSQGNGWIRNKVDILYEKEYQVLTKKDVKSVIEASYTCLPNSVKLCDRVIDKVVVSKSSLYSFCTLFTPFYTLFAPSLHLLRPLSQSLWLTFDGVSIRHCWLILIAPLAVLL